MSAAADSTGMGLFDVMPWWVGWLGPAIFVAGALLWIRLHPSWALRRIRRELAASSQWPDRAALGWEGRILIGSSMILWTAVAVGMHGLFLSDVSRVDAYYLHLGLAVTAIGWALYQSWRFLKYDLEQPMPSFRAHLGEVARRWWPFLALVAVAVLAPSRLASVWMIPWTGLAVAALLGTRYLAEAWVWSGIASPADERVTRLVSSAAARLGSPVPRSFVLQTRAANAVALPARDLVIFTARLVDLLDDDELESIALHEIAHLNERPTVTRLRLAGLLAYLPVLAVKPLVGQGWGFLLAGLAVTFGMGIALRRVGASEEQRADQSAVDSSHESEAFGRALLKLHRSALMPTVVKGDPHGPLHERLLRTGIEPDFEPVAPKRRIIRMVIPAFVYFMVLFVAAVGVRSFINDWDEGTGSHIAISLGWDEEAVLGYVGEQAAWRGDYARALPYLGEAAALDDYSATAALPWVLASSGRCDEVAAAYDDLADSNPLREDLENAALWVSYCASLD